MRQSALLIGGFIVALAVLLGAFLGYRALTAGGTAAALAPATQQAPPSNTPAASVQPSTSATPTPRATPTPKATPTPRATPTAAPSPTATSTPDPGDTQTPRPSRTEMVTVPGAKYTSADVPEGGTVTPLTGGAIRIETGGPVAVTLTVLYNLPAGSLPAGARIASIDTDVCASGSGNFWEVYGPAGSDPDEFEVEAPGPDGCFHFKAAKGSDTLVKTIVEKASQMVVTKIVYTVKLAG